MSDSPRLVPREVEVIDLESYEVPISLNLPPPTVKTEPRDNAITLISSARKTALDNEGKPNKQKQGEALSVVEASENTSPNTTTPAGRFSHSTLGNRALLISKIMKNRTAADRDRECKDKDRVAQAMARYRASIAPQQESREQKQTVGHGSIADGHRVSFNGWPVPAGSSASDVAIVSQMRSADMPSQHPDQSSAALDDIAWAANIQVSDNDDSEAKEKYEQAKREYQEKVRLKQNTFIEDIEMTRLEREERTRIKARSKRKSPIHDEEPQRSDHGYVEDANSLFIPERPGLPSPKALGKNESLDDYELAEPPSKRPKKASRKRQDLTAGELRATMPKETSQKARKSRPRKRDGKTQAKHKKGKRSRTGPNMSNVSSLWTSDIVRDASANTGLPGIPSFTAKDRQQALRELVASIPSQRGAMTSDRQAIADALKKFSTPRSVKSDGQGGWLLKGMRSSLYHHQLLGVGWMRDRENGGEQPYGGIVADIPGFGKTVQVIACTLDDRDAARETQDRTTLIVVPPALVDQWLAEWKKHCDPKVIGRILKYSAGSRIESTDILGDLRSYDCIITTYHEILKSYPLQAPPKDLTTESVLNAWWVKVFTENAGPLHRIRFRRIVLDECVAIKAPDGKISRAVRALTGHFKWCISGTPIQNRSEEFFAYFDFLKVKNTGDYALFKTNYCQGRSDTRTVIDPQRLMHVLQAIMLRRSHLDRLFSRPIVTLPGIDVHTQKVRFNKLERSIYRLVKHKFIQAINKFSQEGKLQSHYRNILTMMHHLRMLTSHVLLVQKVLKEQLTAEDVESLWQLTRNEVQNGGDQLQQNQIAELREMINARSEPKETSSHDCEDKVEAAVQAAKEDTVEATLGGRFRKLLRALKEHKTWAELHERSICHKCKCPPDNAYVTSCMHLYCKECLEAMAVAEATDGNDQSHCLECGEIFTQSSPCSGLNELGWDTGLLRAEGQNRANRDDREKSKKTKFHRRSSPTYAESGGSKDVDWITLSGDLLPSAKTAAAKVQVHRWLEKSPDEKIIIFTQWIDMIRICQRICDRERWKYVPYHGGLELSTRARNIDIFREDKDCKIMLCSLKAGGVGLNLTCASKVIIMDLYWNSSVEQQAFCRCFRIGQQRKVEIIRYVVEDSIDDDLIAMQERKNTEIEAVMGTEQLKKHASVQELLELFGPVSDDNESGFIYVEETEDDETEIPVPRRPF